MGDRDPKYYDTVILAVGAPPKHTQLRETQEKLTQTIDIPPARNLINFKNKFRRDNGGCVLVRHARVWREAKDGMDGWDGVECGCEFLWV